MSQNLMLNFTQKPPTASERIGQLKNAFTTLNNWEDRYEFILSSGKNLPALSEEFKTERYLVKGCQSQVWLYPEKKGDHLFLKADSDALLVKGMISILLYVYSDLAIQEVMATDGNFLKELGIIEHLSMNRSNGLMSMLKQIRLTAFAYSRL